MTVEDFTKIKIEMLKNMLVKVEEAKQLCKVKPELRPRMIKAMAHFVKITLEVCEVEDTTQSL